VDPSVEFHNGLAAVWDTKYAKRSFQAKATAVFSLLDGTDLSGKKWLDAGCGTGSLARSLSEHGCIVEGVDAAPAMVQLAIESARVTPYSDRMTFQLIETLERLPFPEGSFDGILCSSVIEYLDRPKICLEELSRVLKPGGKILISIPNTHSLYRRLEKVVFYLSKNFLNRPFPKYFGFVRNTFSLSEILQLLHEAKINPIRSSYAGLGLPRWIDCSKWVGTMTFILGVKSS
jgi:2-polyprenyl-3-methyl-5-hydroxy-6-metoxy-1,4-benzoquinol methylase